MAQKTRLRPVTMDTRCFHKKVRIFKDTRQKISVPLAKSTNLRKKNFELFKNHEKNNSWADLGPRSAWETLSQMFVRSGEIPSPRQTSIDKPTTAPWNLNGVRSLGAPTHPPVTVFTKQPVIGGGRRPGIWYKRIWALLCRKQATTILDPSPMEKISLFSGLGEERRTRGLLLAL